MIETRTTTNILNTAIHNFEQAARTLGIPKDIAEKILFPHEKIEIRISPCLSNGSLREIPVYIVRHSEILGPSKGGIRMPPTGSLDDVTGLAMEMTWKTSLIGVPFGGGKSGIQCDPTSLQPADKETIIRSFTRGALRHLGPELYIAAPDMGTNEADMGHISDCIAYSRGTSITSGCFVTGKPVLLGGILGRKEATGTGVVFTVQAACEKLGIALNTARVVVQGFGNVGSISAIEIARLGARVIGISDISGGVVNENGLDLAGLADHLRATGTVTGFSGGTPIDNQQLFRIPCDILIPAAAQSQITPENAPHIQAKIIAEGANAPTTPEADDILRERKIFVIPDILCNAGGVFVSYLEYTQETQREQMTLDVVEARLRNRMQQKFQDVYQCHQEKNISMRQAAMRLAVQKVVDGVYARGLLP